MDDNEKTIEEAIQDYRRAEKEAKKASLQMWRELRDLGFPVPEDVLHELKQQDLLDSINNKDE